MGNKVIIDADLICYKIAFSTEKRIYLASNGKEYQYKKEIPKGLDCDLVVQPGSIENTLGNCKVLLQSILNACSPVDSYKLFLTGEGNFRIAIAKQQPYKGNRTLEKPVWYHEVKKYLIKQWDAQVIDGFEADDACRWTFEEDPKNSIIAGEDKDYLIIPNLRMYNIRSKKIITVTPAEAMFNFYYQVLVGDDVDNIVGCKGIGDKKATKILSSLRKEKEMYQACLEQYNKVYGDKGLEYLEENCNLLYLLRHREDKWTAPI